MAQKMYVWSKEKHQSQKENPVTLTSLVLSQSCSPQRCWTEQAKKLEASTKKIKNLRTAAYYIAKKEYFGEYCINPSDPNKIHKNS